MSDAGRTLAVAEAYEWAIDVFESMDRDEALEYLRRVAARQRQSYEREIQAVLLRGHVLILSATSDT